MSKKTATKGPRRAAVAETSTQVVDVISAAALFSWSGAGERIDVWAAGDEASSETAEELSRLFGNAFLADPAQARPPAAKWLVEVRAPQDLVRDEEACAARFVQAVYRYLKEGGTPPDEHRTGQVQLRLVSAHRDVGPNKVDLNLRFDVTLPRIPEGEVAALREMARAAGDAGDLPSVIRTLDALSARLKCLHAKQTEPSIDPLASLRGFAKLFRERNTTDRAEMTNFYLATKGFRFNELESQVEFARLVNELLDISQGVLQTADNRPSQLGLDRARRAFRYQRLDKGTSGSSVTIPPLVVIEKKRPPR